MPKTQEDIRLIQCLKERVKQFRQGILSGRPYVWELRLSLDEFYTLENAINNSISSHSGNHEHLLTEDFALVVVMYLAEWYKRFYKGADTMDENRILALDTDELKKLYELAKIDKNTFVYNASKNPDKTSYRWQESLQVLGGLAVQAELGRDQNDNLLSYLCKIFHGEEIDLDDFKDRNRAVAFQESIARQHSLYEYLKCILEKDERGHRNLPFALSDIENEDTFIPQLIHRIEEANRWAKKEKFDFEWIVNYTASRNQMVRHLRVKLKPEEIGGGKKQYIGYDRLRQPEWGIEHPENIGRIRFYVRFKNGNHYVQKEGKQEEPLFKYDNTGSEVTGFLSVNKEDENNYMNVPVGRFDKVEIVMKYDDECQVVQTLEVKDYMQVYSLPKKPTVFSDRRNSQRPTFLIFSSAYHLTKEYSDLSVVYAHFRNEEQTSEDYCWCPIHDKVVIADSDGKEVMPPFFNRNGLYQVVTKKYLKTIKYKENLYVLYQFVDTDYDEDEIQSDELPVLFGRNGLEVKHYPTRQADNAISVTDYDLEWLKGNRYVDWKKEEPVQGALRLRVTVKGMVFTPKVYYVPFSPSNADQPPIWRDFEHMRICTALDGVEDIQDDFRQLLTQKESDTKQLEIGTKDAKILVDVYRPVIVRELSQKKTSDNDSKVIKYYQKDEQIHIPLINCEQFSVRDFSEDGVKEYQIKSRSEVYYSFPTVNQTGLSKDNYLKEYSARMLIKNIPLDYLKIYIAKADDHPSNLYAWNYKDVPKPIERSSEMKEAGIVFQSLKDNDSPRHYACPIIIANDDDDWDDQDWDDDNIQSEELNPWDCFETIAEHKTYFFLFNPLIKVIAGRTQIKDIFLPLLRKRNYQFNDMDLANLYRFALHFHFDWMLLPRSLWVSEIEAFSISAEERDLLKERVIEFFRFTPKCSDEREQLHLKDFLRKYWEFNNYPRVEDIADKALKLIKGEADALGNIREKDFLRIYDECRFKFIEMSKVVITTD